MNITLSILYVVEFIGAILTAGYMFFFRRQLAGVIRETGIILPQYLLGLIKIAIIGSYTAILITLLNCLKDTLPLWRLLFSSSTMS